MGRAELTGVETRRSSSDRAVAARAAETSELEPFGVEVKRRDHIMIVQPHGELDIATVETLRTTLDSAIAETQRVALDGMESPARLVLDLRGLSFCDSTGLHLLVALNQRAKRDGFRADAARPRTSDRQSDPAERARPGAPVRGARRRRDSEPRLLSRSRARGGVEGVVTSRPTDHQEL